MISPERILNEVKNYVLNKTDLETLEKFNNGTISIREVAEKVLENSDINSKWYIPIVTVIPYFKWLEDVNTLKYKKLKRLHKKIMKNSNPFS